MMEPMRLFLILVGALLLLSVRPGAEAVRGQSQSSIHRSLKKDDRPAPAPAPGSQTFIIENAQGEELDPEEQEEEEFLFDEEDEGNAKDNKDNNQDDEGDASSSVKLPELVLAMSVDVAPASRDVIEDLIEEYFGAQLSTDILGSNYASSELEATLTQSQNFAGTNGIQNLLVFNVKGEVEYDGEPVPRKKEIKERLVAFYIDWGRDDDLGVFLANNGIQGARAIDFYVDGIQMPAFVQPAPSGPATVPGPATSTYDATSTSSSTSTSTTSTSANANAASDEPTDGGNNAGLITGLVLFFFCLIIAALLLYSTRNQLASECGSCWKAAKLKAGMEEKNKRGWRDFEEEGSDTAADQVDIPLSSNEEARKPKLKWPSILQRKREEDFLEEEGSDTFSGQLPPNEESTKPKLKWPSWLQRKKEEEPSQILGQIQVVVDNDHVLKRGGGSYQNYSLPEDASGAIVSHQHSAATVPHANYTGKFGGKLFEDISPQKTLNTSCPSDEDEVSLEDPVVRWGPPTRSTSKLYKGPPSVASPEKSKPRSSFTTSTPAPAPTPEDVEVEMDDCTGLAEWTTYLNPCMLPHLPMFQYESERLDDIVASIPRNKSVLDISDDADTADSPSPPPRRKSRKHRSRSSSRRRSSSRPPSSSGRPSRHSSRSSGRPSSRQRSGSGHPSSHQSSPRFQEV